MQNTGLKDTSADIVGVDRAKVENGAFENAVRAANGAKLGSRHKRVAGWCAGVALFMLGASFAAVPLYDMFCRVTGFGGTTRRAIAPSETVLDRHVTVRFDANVNAGLPWRFEPIERKVEVKYGENVLVHYRATNVSDRTTTGTAAFNVGPEIAGAYFNKLACFCFQEQTLKPGESIDMPVTFFVDPSMVDDRQAAKVTQITLSYTFYPVEAAAKTQTRPSG